jgi:hypothetical protein
MEVKDDGGARSFTRARSYVWLTVIVAIIALVAVGVLHYRETFTRSSAFQDERSFRVLEEIAQQVGNLESSRATLLTTVPRTILEAMPTCEGREQRPQPEQNALGNTVEPRTATNHQTYQEYVARLDFPEARLCLSPKIDDATQKASRDTAVSVSTAQEPQAKPPATRSELADRCTGVGVDAAIFTFDIQRNGLSSVLLCREGVGIVMHEPLLQASTRAISQDFFDEALLAMKDGTVIGEFPLHGSEVGDGSVQLHGAIAEQINIVNASLLLDPPESTTTVSRAGEPKPDTASSKADAADSKTETTDPQAGTVGAKPEHRQPYAQSTRVREQWYRVSILPINAPYPMMVSHRKGTSEYLYVIGLRRLDNTGDILHALWPVGLWGAVLLIGLNLVAWPLLSVAFGPVEESISPRKAVGCVLGLLIVPAILIIGAASLWSDFEIDSMMHSRATYYSTVILSRLHHDLIDGAEILGSFRPLYRSYLSDATSAPTCESIKALPAESRTALPYCDEAQPIDNLPWMSCRGQGCAGQDNVCASEHYLTSQHYRETGCPTIRMSRIDAREPLDRWSQFRSIIGVNEEGRLFGPVFTPFKRYDARQDLDISDRAYFRALKLGQAWSLDMDGGKSVQLVAQRLFNRADGSKALEIAVPLCDPLQPAEHSGFCGIITGDVRMHSLMASVRSPLLKFAVIDTATGTVVFSSTDSRSLAENFFLESEQNPALQAAIASRQTHEFTGRYLGDPHQFVYAPLKNVPWGVLVFYSEKDVADLPFRAGAAALSAYAGSLLALAVVGYIGRWLIRLFRPRLLQPLALARRAWPRIPVPEVYRNMSRLRPSVWVLLALLVVSLRQVSLWGSVGLAFSVLIAASLLGFAFKPAPQVPQRRPASEQYSECVLIVLTAVSIIPAYGLYLEFHRLQVQALVRDGLVQNAVQLQRRYDVIQQDLRRWIPPDGQEWNGKERLFPDVWMLVSQPNAGMSDSTDDLPQELELQQLGPGMVGSAGPGLFPSMGASLVWWAVVGSPEQERRLALLDVSPFERRPNPHSPLDLVCGGTVPPPALDGCVARMADGSRVSLRVRALSNDNLLEQDFEWMWVRVLALCGAAIVVAIGVAQLARTFTVRLLGLEAPHVLNPLVGPYPNEPAPTPEAFARTWASLGHSERLALYQIASGELVNPRNESAIQTLLDSQLIRLNPWPTLRWEELKPLILRAQSAAEFEQWQRDARRGTWKTVRIPLFILLMVIIAWFSWAAGGSMKALSAILAAAIALLTQLVQLFNFARGSGAQKSGSE